MKKLFGTNFFCCGGTRTKGNDINTSYLSLIEKDLSGGFLPEELKRNGSLWDTDSERGSITPKPRGRNVFWRSNQSNKSTNLGGGLRPSLRTVFNQVNKKRDGRLTFSECFNYLPTKGVIVDRAVAVKVFQMFDHSETGYLTFMEFCKICPPDGHFARAFQAEVDRVENKDRNSSTKIQRKRSDLSSETSRRKNCISSRGFLRSLDDASSSESVKPGIKLPKEKHPQEDFGVSSDEDNPELMNVTLYVRRTINDMGMREPSKEVQNSRRDLDNPKERTGLVRLLDEGSSDFGTPRGGDRETMGFDTSGDEQTPQHNIDSHQQRETLSSLHQVERPEYQIKYTSLNIRSQETSTGSINRARSPATSIGLQSPVFGENLLVYIDYGALEEPSKLLVASSKGVDYLKDLISRTKDTPPDKIRMRYRDRVISNCNDTLEQLGFEHQSKVIVDLAGGSPMDEANRVISNFSFDLKNNSQPNDYEAYFCYPQSSKEAVDRIKNGMEKKGWALLDPQIENLRPTDVQSLLEALKNCSLFVLFITCDMIDDSWVLFQVLVSQKLGMALQVIYETDLRRGGFKDSAALCAALLSVITKATLAKSIGWTDKIYQQYEIFDRLANTLRHSANSVHHTAAELVVNEAANVMSQYLGYPSVLNNGFEAYKSSEAMSSGTIEEKLEGMNQSTSGDVDLEKCESLGFNHEIPFSKSNISFRPQFTQTTTRIATFKEIVKSGKGALTISDIDDYLQTQQVYLTTDELSVLLTVMSTRKQNSVSISEFYKYCPSKGEFAQKVWESIVLRR